MDHQDLATAFVMGALSPAERTDAATRRLYDKALDRAIAAEESRLAALDVGPHPSPAAAMWDRISHALDTEQKAFTVATAEPFGAGDWVVHNERIDCKTLWGGKGLLLRCEPGAVEDDHMQDSDEDEHILVVAGTVTMGGRTFSVGDTILVPAGTMHHRMASRDGCILFSHYSPAA